MTNRLPPLKSAFSSRLGLKFGAVAGAALLLALSVFLLLYEGVFWFFLNSSDFEPFWRRETDAAIEDFQSYVTETGLTVDEAIRDISWEEDYRSVRLYLVESTDTAALKKIMQSEHHAGTPVVCADGMVYAFAHRTVVHYENIALIVSVLCAAISFFLVLLPYVLRTIRRISYLSGEMEILSGGDLTYPIESRGTDELAELGRSIEAMRCSVVEQMGRENAAILANSRLITSLSHDLRTPLTKLTGYLEILRRDTTGDEATRRRYLNSALEKAEEMKALSDEMFRHFQVRPDAEHDAGFETVSGPLLLGQLLVELCCDLTDAGFVAQPPALEGEYLLRVRTFELRRIFDNLFSNLRKYADPAEPIRITVCRGDSGVTVTVDNAVLTGSTAESAGVGLTTVEHLTRRNGGTMSVDADDRRFRLTLFFPTAAADLGRRAKT